MLLDEITIRAQIDPSKKVYWSIGLFVGLIVWETMKSGSNTTPAIVLFELTVYFILSVYYKRRWKFARMTYLRKKYQNEAIVIAIIGHNYWVGQTSEQLQDSLGVPLDKDDSVSKTRRREVWKYNRRGVNQYRLRITLDDSRVVRWARNSMR